MLSGKEYLVDDVMRKWPSTIPVFLKYRMKCVGCPIGPFHTIQDACREHDVDCSAFVVDLNIAIGLATRSDQLSKGHFSEDSAKR